MSRDRHGWRQICPFKGRLKDARGLAEVRLEVELLTIGHCRLGQNAPPRQEREEDDQRWCSGPS